MRLGIVSTFPPFRGGISTFNHRLMQALVDAGHEVHVVNWSRQYPQLFFPGKTQWASTTNSKGPEYPALLDSINPLTWKRTAKHLQDLEPLDAVVFPFWHAMLAPALTGVAKRMRKNHPGAPKLIGLFHNAGSHDGLPMLESLTRRLMANLDEVWTLSQEVKDQLLLQKQGLNIRVLFHPLYNHFPQLSDKILTRENMGLPPNAQVLLFFGLVRPYKGLMRLLDVWDEFAVDEPKAHLLIAGECYGDWTPYQLAIESLNCQDRVLVDQRFIPDDEIGKVFGAADVVVLPYESASQSGVTAMSLHYGIPTIASNVGGLAEYIRPGLTGELFEAQNSSSLVAALQRAIKTEYPETAFAAAREEFSWTRFATASFSS